MEGKAQETRSRGVQEGEARETRRKEVQQGEETSKKLVPLEAENNPLKKKQGERARDRSMPENLQQKADRGSSRKEMRRLQGKERRRLTEREKPRMKPARTVCPREGNRTSFLGGEQELHAPAQGRVGKA